MAISYDDSRTTQTKQVVQTPKPKGVVYGGSQDSDLITQQQRKYPVYGPKSNDWWNSYLYQLSQNRQNVGEGDQEYLPGGHTRNNERFIQAPNFGGGDSGLGIGGVNIPSFGVGSNPNTVKFVNPTPVVTLPTAPKQPTFLDLVKKAFVDAANSPTVSGIGGFGGVTFPGTAEIPDLSNNPSVLDQYYQEHMGANGEVAEARKQNRLDPNDTEYGWRLRDLYNERRVNELTKPPKPGPNPTFQYPYTGYPWGYMSNNSWGGWGGGGGGASYKQALENYYNALMTWRIPVE